MKKAYLISIEAEEEKELMTSRDGEFLNVNIPGNSFSGYGMVRIEI